MKAPFACPFILTMLLVTVPVPAVEPADEARLDLIEQRGAEVMPFSLERTTHIFTKTEDGGLQQVLVKDASNSEQIMRIRDHLLMVSTQFARGDFSDPAKIHGDDMPGLAELRKAQAGQIKVAYRELPHGAEIEYSAEDADLINAIHHWFDAQLGDHARHAVSGHPDHTGAR